MRAQTSVPAVSEPPTSLQVPVDQLDMPSTQPSVVQRLRTPVMEGTPLGGHCISPIRKPCLLSRLSIDGESDFAVASRKGREAYGATSDSGVCSVSHSSTPTRSLSPPPRSDGNSGCMLPGQATAYPPEAIALSGFTGSPGEVDDIEGSASSQDQVLDSRALEKDETMVIRNNRNEKPRTGVTVRKAAKLASVGASNVAPTADAPAVNFPGSPIPAPGAFRATAPDLAICAPAPAAARSSPVDDTRKGLSEGTACACSCAAGC